MVNVRSGGKGGEGGEWWRMVKEVQAHDTSNDIIKSK